MPTLREMVESAYRDYETDGVPASGDHEPVKSEIRAALGKRLETELSAVGAGLLRFSTAAARDAVVDSDDGQLAYVYDDGGNNGVFQWDDGAGVWVAADWYFDAVAGVVDEHLADAVIARGTVATEDATDAYFRRWIRGIVITGMDADDVPFMRYESIFFPGIPLYRIALRLHSTKLGGVEVARYAFQQATDPVAGGQLPEVVQLTAMADGAHIGDDPGIAAVVVQDLDAIEWTHTPVTVSTVAETGIEPGHIVTTEDIRNRWLADMVPPDRRFTVGAVSGDYATIALARAAIENPLAAGTISRTTYPSSHICTPATPCLIDVVDPDHVEQAVPFNYLGIWQSNLRLPHGCILRIRHDTLIYMDDASTAPVMEVNFTNRIEGTGTIEQRGSGYVLHIDNANGISDPSPTDPQIMRRAIQTVIGPVTLRKTHDDATPLIGSGISNQQDIELRGTHLERTVNVAGTDFILVHTSPDQTHPGRIVLDGVTSNADDFAGVALLTVTKSHANEVRHGIRVVASDCPKIEEGNSVGGDPGFVRLCNLVGQGIVVTGDLEP